MLLLLLLRHGRILKERKANSSFRYLKEKRNEIHLERKQKPQTNIKHISINEYCFGEHGFYIW